MCKYVIVGKSASGKDYCKNMFIEHGFKPLKQYTTRNKRKNDNDEYYYVKKSTIEDMRHKLKFISLKKSNKGHYYGFTLKDIETCDVAILSTSNIYDLKTWYPNVLKFSTIIYLDTPEEIRRKRLKSRLSGDNVDEKINEIISKDEIEFKKFNYFDIIFNNNNDVFQYINKITQNEQDSFGI